MDISAIPTDWDEFLIWFQQQTEEIWSQYKTLTFGDFLRAGVGGTSWRKGTKWVGGFSEEEIVSAENRWNIKFPPDHRRFLRVLGAPDRMLYGVHWSDTKMVESAEPSFYDWRKDTKSIKRAMNWPLEGLFFDLECNSLWHESWGTRPDDLEDQKTHLSNLVRAAPPLVPIIGHRYLIGTPFKAGNPVLSVYQSDIVVYGADIRKFLILEFCELLEIDRDEAGRYAYTELSNDAIASIPFWGEFILE